jgi:hypothetical protein
MERAPAMIARILAVVLIDRLREINVMKRSAKAIAALASVAVLACSMFAIGWVGLALLGY